MGAYEKTPCDLHCDDNNLLQYKNHSTWAALPGRIQSNEGESIFPARVARESYETSQKCHHNQQDRGHPNRQYADGVDSLLI